MANPTKASIIVRVRHRLVEEGGSDFWDDDRLWEWFGEGHAMQHRAVFDEAEKQGLHNHTSHPYLRIFADTASRTLVAGQQDYDLDGFTNPQTPRIWKVSGLRILGRYAVMVPFARDEVIRRSPQLQPQPGAPLWAMRSDAPGVRVYLAGDRDLKPLIDAPGGLRLDFYTDVFMNSNFAPVPDPYNVGPIEYTVMMGLARERTDGTFFAQKMQAHAANIFPPPRPQVTR